VNIFLTALILGISASLGACLAAGDPTPGGDLLTDTSFGDVDMGGARDATIAVTVNATELSWVSEYCYALEARDGDGHRLAAWGAADGPFPAAGRGGSAGPSHDDRDDATPLCVSRDDSSELTLTVNLPCSVDAPETSVRLWLQAACEAWNVADECIAVQGFINPCGTSGCELRTTCRPNAETPVTFDLDMLASVGRGFLDPAYVFGGTACNVRVSDCAANDGGERLRLLVGHDGERVSTVVASLKCFKFWNWILPPGARTPILNLADLELSCGEDSGSLSFDGLGDAAVPLLPADTLPWPVAVYRGVDTSMARDSDFKSVYLSVAIGIDTAIDCKLRWRVMPSVGELTLPEPPFIDRYVAQGLIEFDATIPGGDTCVARRITRAPDSLRALHNPAPDGAPFIPLADFGATMSADDSDVVRFEARDR